MSKQLKSHNRPTLKAPATFYLLLFAFCNLASLKMNGDERAGWLESARLREIYQIQKDSL